MNGRSGGSYKVLDASVVNIYIEEMPQEGKGETDNDNDDDDKASGESFLELEVKVHIHNEKEPKMEREKVFINAEPNPQVVRFKNIPQVAPRNVQSQDNNHPYTINTVDDFLQRLSCLCTIAHHPQITGKLIQLGFQIGGDKRFLLKEDMYLNHVPHNRYVRQYFYDLPLRGALEAVIACSNGEIGNRMKITTLFPEMNNQMDSYRIGTLLELARAVAIRLAEQNLRVRVCVQGSMGVKHKLVVVKGKKSEADGQENLERMKSADVIRRFYLERRYLVQ